MVDLMLRRYTNAALIYSHDRQSLLETENGKSTKHFLLRAFRSLPNLTRFVIDTQRCKIGAKSIRADFGDFMLGTEFTRAVEYPLLLCFKALVESGCILTSFRFGIEETTNPQRREELSKAYRYLATSALPLRRCHNTVLPSALLEATSILYQRKYQAAPLFSELRECVVGNLECSIFSEELKDYAMAILRIIVDSQKMESLEVGQIFRGPLYPSPKIWPRLIISTCWQAPNLRRLVLCMMVANPDELVDVFERFAATLEYVAIDKMRLHIAKGMTFTYESITWGEIMDELRLKLHWPKLQRFKLTRGASNIYEEPDELSNASLECRDYLTRKPGVENPVEEWETQTERIWEDAWLWGLNDL